MPRSKSQLYVTEAVKVVLADSQNLTQAQVTMDTLFGVEVVGAGEARRAPGDRRDMALGEYLALARAFEDAARYFWSALADLGYEPKG